MTAQRIEEARRFLGRLFRDGEIVELRTALPGGRMIGGRHDDLARLAWNAIGMQEQHGAESIYITLNPIARDSRIVERYGVTNNVLVRVERDGRTEEVKYTAGNGDIGARAALIIDVDPVRPSGVCSTETEKAAGRQVMDNVIAYLTSKGWPQPILVDSGNGYHCYYAIDRLSPKLPAWEYCLRVLSMMFDTPQAHIDTSVAKPGQLVRLPGSINMKGENAADRPHRVVRVLHYPDRFVPVDHGRMILGLAREHGYVLPDERQALPKARSGIALDVEGMRKLIAEYPSLTPIGQPYVKGDGLTYFFLRVCPHVGRAHRNHKPAFTLGDYGPGFSCFSSDCAGVTFWQILRKLERETGHKCEALARCELTWREYFKMGLMDQASALADADEEFDADEWNEMVTALEEREQDDVREESEDEEMVPEPDSTPVGATLEMCDMTPADLKFEVPQWALRDEERITEKMREREAALKTDPDWQFDQRAWDTFNLIDWHTVPLEMTPPDWQLTDDEVHAAWYETAQRRMATAELSRLIVECDRIHRERDITAMCERLGKEGLYWAALRKERERLFPSYLSAIEFALCLKVTIGPPRPLPTK